MTTTLQRIDENLRPMERDYLDRRKQQIQREIVEAERNGDEGLDQLAPRRSNRPYVELTEIIIVHPRLRGCPLDDTLAGLSTQIFDNPAKASIEGPTSADRAKRKAAH